MPFSRISCYISYFFFGLFFFSAFAFADGENVVEYRRILIPQEQIDNSLILLPSFSVDRQEFERKLALVEERTEEQNDKQPYLSQIILKAKLDGRQLTSGKGFFALQPQADLSGSIPLNPLTLAVNSLRWSDNTEAIFFCEPNGENRLLVPSATDSSSYDQLQFCWSQQSRRDYRNEIVFDLSLPPCLSIELQLDLPNSMALTASSGLVLLDERSGTIEPEFRTWRILLGHHSNTTLIITLDKTLPSIKQKAANHQTVIHTVTSQGLDTLVRIKFEETDSLPEELLLELEMPLRPFDVQYGNRPASWTRLPLMTSDVTTIRIDLSPYAGEEPQDISIRSLGPLRENQRWVLPRIRVVSSDIFWAETRCGVSVDHPLRVRNLITHKAVQVTPRSLFDWAKQELYVFQFFQDDAQIELDVIYSTPLVSVNSFSQLFWNDNEIRTTVYLDCSVNEGERFTFECPVSEYWVIDDVTAFFQSGTASSEGDTGFSWNVLGDTEQTLYVQMNRPLQPRQSVAMQIACRYANSSQTQFRLANLFPLVLPLRHDESHHIAAKLDLTTFLLKSDTDVSTFNVPQSITIGGRSLVPLGNVYPLNSRTQDIFFEKERMRPNYKAEITGNIYVDEDVMIPSFRINITPLDSSMSRVFIHFTPTGTENTLGQKTSQQWDWSLDNADLARTFRVFRSSPDTIKTLLLASELQNWGDELEYGEIWEIRFDELQTTPFELSAVSLIPLADSVTVPLACVPLASAQQGELKIESPQHFDYRIINTRLDSIPLAPPSWDRYQNVRAAFRYDPPEEIRRAQHSPLLLQRLTPSEQIDVAWVWSLRLDSQHDPEGAVQSRALFFVENQGKNSLQITLPRNINATDVFAVWLNSQQIPWQYDEERRTIDVALPISQRFVSVAIEYAYQDIPLVQQRKLHPRYPTTDVPILSGNWISWFPPEFDVSLRYAVNEPAAQSTNPVVLSRALDYLLTGTYRSFFGTVWDDAFYGEQRRLDAEKAAKFFFAELADSFQKNPHATWGDLMGDEKILPAIRGQLANDNAHRTVESRFLFDKKALAFLGITPATPVAAVGPVHEDNVREKLFENTGLILLISTRTRSDGIKEYVFALTTPTTLSLHRQFQPIQAGHCVRAVRFEIVESFTQSSQWIPAPRWLSETTLSSIPWSISPQMMQRSSLVSDWNAFELPINTEQSLYIVHRQTFAALQWIAFLSVVLITSRKPFSSPVVLLIMLIIFEVIARIVAPCYIGIPSGALLGVLVSFAFVLIRSQINLREPPPGPRPQRESTECSVSFVKMPLTVRCFVPGCLLTVLGTLSASAQTYHEPYQIIYPTDSQGRIGQEVLVPAEFLDLLQQKIKTDVPATSQRWNIIKAVYQGSLIRNSSGYLECSDDFKAVFDIYLDTTGATITLPDLPAVQGRYYWNSRPIQPIWNDEEQSDSLAFAIENETPGKHVLEIALSPKAALHNDGETFQIAFAIPKIPDSTIRLNVPPDAPPISIFDALGAVTVNTSILPVLVAELGPTQQLSLSWTDDPSRGETLVNDVQQFFRIRVKPLRIELETLFRFQIDNGSVRHLTIQTDPRWTLMGQFNCIEYPNAIRLETGSDSQSFDGLSTFPNSVSRIHFQSPVSGTITLEANFAIQNSNVIGNLRLPEFSAWSSRITKSMLAVYAEPIFELDFPVEGHSSGFESGWQGTPLFIPPLFREVPFWDITAPLLTGQNESAPDAEYDLLAQTESDWTLNIRIKKVVPDVSIVHSVQFDAGESKVQIVGEFTASSDVFQQYFSVDRPIQIETLEVRDTQGDVVESRFQQTDPDTMPEQYLVLFKRPVAGKYTVAIHGFFESDTSDDLPLQPIPVLTFGESPTTTYSLNLFRTSAVMAKIPTEQSGWEKLTTLPTAPESFPLSIPLGTWQRTETKPLQFILPLNRPNVKCQTVLSLEVDADDQATMTLNYTANVTGGELNTLSFRWDERFGIIQTLDPKASWSLDQSQRTLTVFLNEPMQGEQSFKIIVTLNTTGAVSLPNTYPLPGRAEQFESDIIVDLPLRQGNEMIPWDLNQLAEIDEWAPDAQRLRLRATETDFSAIINRDAAKLTASFYDIGFLIRRDGTVFGVVTVDLRNRGQDSFVLQMPKGYEPIQISSTGLPLGRTRLAEDNRWRISIGTSDYPQRLNILFRALLPMPIKQWNRETVVSTLQFPYLEGVAVQETIWSISFEGCLASLNVTTFQELGAKECNLGEHTPIAEIAAALSLIGMNLIREDNMLRQLQSLPVSLRQEEKQDWFLHWSEEWNTVADKVDFQISHLSLTSPNFQPQLLVQSVDSDSEKAGVRSFLERMGTRTPQVLRDYKDQTVQDKFGSTIDSIARQPIPILTSQVYWQGRVTEETQYLFGMEEGAIWSVRLTSVPKAGVWLPQFSEHIAFWISLSLFLPVFVLLSVRWIYVSELWLQFPHFWGMTIGILFWIFLPKSFFGPAIMLLSFLSLFRPSWTRHRFRMHS